MAGFACLALNSARAQTPDHPIDLHAGAAAMPAVRPVRAVHKGPLRHAVRAASPETAHAVRASGAAWLSGLDAGDRPAAHAILAADATPPVDAKAADSAPAVQPVARVAVDPAAATSPSVTDPETASPAGAAVAALDAPPEESGFWRPALLSGAAALMALAATLAVMALRLRRPRLQRQGGTPLLDAYKAERAREEGGVFGAPVRPRLQPRSA